ncbi:MAG TPA: hypothetical protein VMT91_14865 [Anaerolineales bacterium]|nr:hypothetical protein [Anaerolineales bacterium]
MEKDFKIRWNWLKVVYILTIIVAGGLGLATILAPAATTSFLGITCARATYGIVGSVYLAFGILSILGLREPLKFVPVLLLQLTYKTAWLLGVALPLLVQGRLPDSEISTIIIFVIIVALDLIAIPFKWVFSKKPERDLLG